MISHILPCYNFTGYLVLQSLLLTDGFSFAAEFSIGAKVLIRVVDNCEFTTGPLHKGFSLQTWLPDLGLWVFLAI